MAGRGGTDEDRPDQQGTPLLRVSRVSVFSTPRKFGKQGGPALNIDSDKTGHPKKDAFLAVYELCANVRESCAAADVSRTTYYRWREEDPGFVKALACARDAASDRLEREAVRRASEGVDEPVFHKGGVCGVVRKYSDTLLIFLMKGANPAKYRERFEHEVTGSVEHLVKVIKGVDPEVL